MPSTSRPRCLEISSDGGAQISARSFSTRPVRVPAETSRHDARRPADRARNAGSLSIRSSRLRQRRGVADRKVAGIVGAQQSDRSVDARGEHRNARCDRLGDDVRPALAHRREHHGLCARQQATHLRGRPVATPHVAGILSHFGLCRAAHLASSAAPRWTMRRCELAGRSRAASAARIGSFTARRCPITATSKLRPDGAARRTMAPTDGSPAPCARNFAGTRSRASSCSTISRSANASDAQCRRRIAIEVFVDVGAGQGHDQRPFRVELTKARDAVGAAPGMQSDHQLRGLAVVAVGDTNVVAEPAQNARPAHRRGPVARP